MHVFILFQGKPEVEAQICIFSFIFEQQYILKHTVAYFPFVSSNNKFWTKCFAFFNAINQFELPICIYLFYFKENSSLEHNFIYFHPFSNNSTFLSTICTFVFCFEPKNIRRAYIEFIFFFIVFCAKKWFELQISIFSFYFNESCSLKHEFAYFHSFLNNNIFWNTFLHVFIHFWTTIYFEAQTCIFSSIFEQQYILKCIFVYCLPV